MRGTIEYINKLPYYEGQVSTMYIMQVKIRINTRLHTLIFEGNEYKETWKVGDEIEFRAVTPSEACP